MKNKITETYVYRVDIVDYDVMYDLVDIDTCGDYFSDGWYFKNWKYQRDKLPLHNSSCWSYKLGVF